ncbi:MAG: hypothetical protein GOMPHAMPRED_007161 [Gomphillus americanus]|uniref:Uncharacterized protein n=1 Tax=Gomphillus americanus TaxID=1940652 RepID=A0A8H3IY04_9LECA|nr:MAG: hypothetical protein GOMPHAMPRED_007161 [Gomphillus americanus]
MATEALRQSPHSTTLTSTTTTNNTTTAQHALKRKTEDDLASEQRLAKRFHLLNLGKPRHQITAEDIQKVHIQLENEAGEEGYGGGEDEYIIPDGPRLRRSRSNAFSDSMNVDDSRDRIFIHSLEDELADLSSDEEHPIFIPDIERRLNMLPTALLRPDHVSRASNELVLYEVPSSLSIPIEKDSARKAIMESRHRAQQQALHGYVGVLEPEFPSIVFDHSDTDAMDVS